MFIFMTRYVLISVLAACIPMAIGCGPAGSLNKESSEATISDDSADSDLKPTEVNEAESLAVGNQAPDFEIERMGGELLRLSSCIAETKQPTVLLFDRANW